MYILIWRWNKNSYDIHGLSANDSDSIVQKHKPPILLKTIDFKNEKEVVYEKIETASNDDIKMFSYFNLARLRGYNQKNIYELLPNAEYIEENWDEVVDKLISLTPPRKYPKELKEVAIQYMPLFLEDCPYYKEAKCLRFFDEL